MTKVLVQGLRVTMRVTTYKVLVQELRVITHCHIGYEVLLLGQGL
jgi:hypothetical protein